MITRTMNTTRMSEFLAQVSAAHRRDFIVMVVDGASSHKAHDLVVPENMRLLRLPPYSPELRAGSLTTGYSRKSKPRSAAICCAR